MPNWIRMFSDADRAKVAGWVSKAPPGTSIAFRRPNRRSKDQNDFMWPWLRIIARNVEWAGKLRSADDWKDLFTAALKRYDVVPGIEDGIVQLGLHTSEMTKKEMSELLEYIIHFAAERNIDLDNIEDYRPSK
jgi:hypothetical protein